jgi:phosphohistidine phosphatase SixA
MIELILIRHAHAGPYTLPDEARKLSMQGEDEARQLKPKLTVLPEGHWLVSSVARTRQTFELISDASAGFSECWYHASGPDYLKKFQEMTDPVIYLVAHNPSISFVASYFSGEQIQMETANCVHLQWPSLHSWEEVTQGSATIKTRF